MTRAALTLSLLSALASPGCVDAATAQGRDAGAADQPARYRVYPNATTAQRQADAVWEIYAAEQRTARGLPPGSSLDTRRGQVVPPITVRYVEVVTAEGETRAALPVDEYAEQLDGRSTDVPVDGGAPVRVTVDTDAPVEREQLPERLRDDGAAADEAAMSRGARRPG